MPARRSAPPWHVRHRRWTREHGRKHRVVLRRLRERAGELRATRITRAEAVGQRWIARRIGAAIRRPVRVADPADAAVPRRARGQRFADLDDGAVDRVEIDRGADGRGARVLIVLREFIPVGVPGLLVAEATRAGRGAVLPLVVHGDVRVEDPLLHPASPVLQRLAIRPRLRPVAAIALRTVPVGDRVRADAKVRLDRVRLDVDLADDVGDLVAPPLRPLRIVRERPVDATGRGLEAIQRDGVVAPRVVRGPGGERQVGISHAVEVEAIDRVVPRNGEVHLRDVVGGVGVAWIEEPVRRGARALAKGSVVTNAEPVVVSGLRRPVLVERVGRIERRDRAVPERGRDDPGMDLNARPVGFRDDRVEWVVGTRRDVRLRSRHARAVAEAVTAPPDLNHEGVDVRGLRRIDELRHLCVVEDPLTECIHPQGAELACRRARLRRKAHGENDHDDERDREHAPHDDLQSRDAAMVRGRRIHRNATSPRQAARRDA